MGSKAPKVALVILGIAFWLGVIAQIVGFWFCGFELFTVPPDLVSGVILLGLGFISFAAAAKENLKILLSWQILMLIPLAWMIVRIILVSLTASFCGQDKFNFYKSLCGPPCGNTDPLPQFIPCAVPAGGDFYWRNNQHFAAIVVSHVFIPLVCIIASIAGLIIRKSWKDREVSISWT